jgi:hypothetical protein
MPCTLERCCAITVSSSLSEMWGSFYIYTENDTDTKNAGFVIGSGAILGVGASFLWISQGKIQYNASLHAKSDSRRCRHDDLCS